MAGNDFIVSALPGVSSLDIGSELAGFKKHKPWPAGMYSTLLLKTADLRLLLIAMETGAKMKEHHADGAVSIHALQGKLRVHVLKQVRDLDTGQILTLEPGINHDVEAREEAAFLVTILWPRREKP